MKKVICIMLLACLFASAASATNNSVATGNWSNAGTWNAGLPAASDWVYVIRNSDVTADTAGLTAGELIVGHWYTGMAKLYVNAGADMVLNSTGWHAFEVGYGWGGPSDGTVWQTGGRITAQGAVEIGGGGGGGAANGNYYMSGGDLVVTPNSGYGAVPMFVGYGGANGTFVQTGGNVTLNGSDLCMGYYYGDFGNSYYSIANSSTLSGANMWLSYYGNNAEFRVVGSQPTVNFTGNLQALYGLDGGGVAKLGFDIDAGGISPIQLGGYAYFINPAVIDVTGGVVGQSYKLIDAASGFWYLSSLSVTDPSKYELSLDYNNYDLWVNVIPEPATISLLALGGLSLIRRRK